MSGQVQEIKRKVDALAKKVHRDGTAIAAVENGLAKAKKRGRGKKKTGMKEPREGMSARRARPERSNTGPIHRTDAEVDAHRVERNASILGDERYTADVRELVLELVRKVDVGLDKIRHAKIRGVMLPAAEFNSIREENKAFRKEIRQVKKDTRVSRGGTAPRSEPAFDSEARYNSRAGQGIPSLGARAASGPGIPSLGARAASGQGIPSLGARATSGLRFGRFY